MRPNGGWSSSGTQNMQSSTGQYSTQAGEPAHPVQHSVMTANSLGFFLRGVARPLDFGSNLSSSGTMPTAFVVPPDAAGMRCIIAQNGGGDRNHRRPQINATVFLTLVLLMFFTVMAPSPVLGLALVVESVIVHIGLAPCFKPSGAMPRPHEHPSCDNPCAPDRTPCVSVLPVRAFRGHPA